MTITINVLFSPAVEALFSTAFTGVGAVASPVAALAPPVDKRTKKDNVAQMPAPLPPPAPPPSVAPAAPVTPEVVTAPTPVAAAAAAPVVVEEAKQWTRETLTPYVVEAVSKDRSKLPPLYEKLGVVKFSAMPDVKIHEFGVELIKAFDGKLTGK